jgi:DNA-binding winged helix-turn-helix (wHTH) protein/tetratricopeptide (TPR) repeat protein
VISFGPFKADLQTRELRKNGVRLRLPNQSFQILEMLLERPGQLVGREELHAGLWPSDTFVDFEKGINAAVKRLREALGDSPEKPELIETLPKRGYRFIGSIAPPSANPLSEAVGKDHHRNSLTIATWVVGATAAVALVVGIYFFFHRRTALTDRDTIVLAEFTNTTGDPVFDTTLRQGLEVQLEQSPFLSIVSDERIQQTLRLMGKSPDARLTPEISREICERTGSTVVLDGSISRLGGHYVIGLKVLECKTGVSLGSSQAEVDSRERVLKAVGESATKIREKLGESLATIQRFDKPVEQATTPSLEALKAYTLGIRAADANGDIEAIPFLKHAIELDPNFSLAYSKLASLYYNLGELEKASEYAQWAFDRRDRASAREQLEISATYYYAVPGNLDQELRVYRVWEQTYPRDWVPRESSSVVLNIFGEYDMALREAQAALLLNPDHANNYVNVESNLLFLDRQAEAKQVAQAALAKGLDTPALHAALYGLAFLEGDRIEMTVQLAALSAKAGEGFGLAAQSNTEAYCGHLTNARGLSKRAVRLARRENLDELAAQFQGAQALREAEFGNSDLAKQTVAETLTLSSGRSAKLLASLALARLGDITRAHALADELNVRFPSDTMLQRYWLPTIRGSIELARKNPAGALTALQDSSYELGSIDGGNLYPIYVRGQAYLMARKGKEAASEFKQLIDHRSIVLNSPLGALTHLGLARAHAIMGDTAQARVDFDDFFALWKDADTDIPVLTQAKVEYAKLQ